MSNKTYNNIKNLIAFIATIAFAVCKVIGVISASWWLIVVPLLLAMVFQVKEDDDDDEGGSNSSNNLKMA